MILPGTEEYFRSGLAKSAFRESIYSGMPLDYYLPGINITYRLASLFLIRAKFYQVHDLFLAFFVPYSTATKALKLSNKAAPVWRAFMEALIKSGKYVEINKITKGSMELAAAAAAKVLARIELVTVEGKFYRFNELDDAVKRQKVDMPSVEKAFRDSAQEALKNAEVELKMYLEHMADVEAAASVLAGGHGYSLDGLSIWHFYERPDEFRKHVKVLVGAALWLKRFMRALPTSLEMQVVESRWGGIEGVAKMMHFSQLREALPAELALADIAQALFAVKLAQLSLNVYGHAATIKPVIFVDKSGSMAEELADLRMRPDDPAWKHLFGRVTKISLAAGLALALHRRLDAEVYLFDTEVERMNSRDVVETLLKIRASGGTDISAVMEEILRMGRPDRLYVIISDGITDAPKELVKSFIERYGPKTKLILVPPSEERYDWVEALKALGNVAYARDVAEFEEAAKRLLTTAV
jgi:uncharacterized protein with von Willebrand factor type A (vWA) domain